MHTCTKFNLEMMQLDYFPFFIHEWMAFIFFIIELFCFEWGSWMLKKESVCQQKASEYRSLLLSAGLQSCRRGTWCQFMFFQLSHF